MFRVVLIALLFVGAGLVACDSASAWPRRPAVRAQNARLRRENQALRNELRRQEIRAQQLRLRHH